MKVINVYRDRLGHLNLGVHGRYYPFSYRSIESAMWDLSAVASDPDFYDYYDDEEISYWFPNGLEAAFVTSITEEELNNV